MALICSLLILWKTETRPHIKKENLEGRLADVLIPGINTGVSEAASA
jgi:hypothetical protein